jgi:uncharacterized protein YceH (UPF0502 family)
VEEALRDLTDKGLVRQAAPEPGERATKFQHELQSAITVSSHADLAVLAVLMLRGPQTPGELRTNTLRYETHFSSLSDVERSLERLASHQPPLVRNQGRNPGQSQDRWVDTLSPDPDKHKPRVRAGSRNGAGVPAGRSRGGSTPGGQPDAGAAELERLQAEVTELREQLRFLYRHLNLD